MKQNSYEQEYLKLKSLFENVDSSKASLVDELIKQVCFIKCELIKLNKQILKHGTVQFSKSGKQRITEVAKYYNKLINIYSNAIKNLNSIMQKNIITQDDEFDTFMRSVSDELK